MPFNIGAGELILVLVLAIFIFGPKKLPEIGRTIGKTLKEFRRSSTGNETITVENERVEAIKTPKAS